MYVDIVRHPLAVHLRPELRILEHQLFGNDARLEDRALTVDVVQIHVDRAHPLLKAAAEEVPLRGREDAGNDVEGDEALGRFRFAIDGEGDADAPEQQLGFLTTLTEEFGRLALQPIVKHRIGGAHLLIETLHLIESDRHHFLQSRKPPQPGSAEGLWLQASGQVFLKGYKTEKPSQPRESAQALG